MLDYFFDGLIVGIPAISLPIVIARCWIDFQRGRRRPQVPTLCQNFRPTPIAVAPFPAFEAVTVRWLRSLCSDCQVPGWSAAAGDKATLYAYVRGVYEGAIA